MKGVLVFSPNKGNWCVEYEEENRKVTLEVRPNRIEHLNSVGVFLQNMRVVDFQIEHTHEFPYSWAVPYVEEDKKTTLTPKRQIVKRKRITLWLAGFHTDEIDIECDGYDASSSGYWYFYNNRNGGRDYIGAYPIIKTIIHQIEEFETEI